MTPEKCKRYSGTSGDVIPELKQRLSCILCGRNCTDIRREFGLVSLNRLSLGCESSPRSREDVTEKGHFAIYNGPPF